MRRDIRLMMARWRSEGRMTPWVRAERRSSRSVWWSSARSELGYGRRRSCPMALCELWDSMFRAEMTGFGFGVRGRKSRQLMMPFVEL